MAYEQQISPTSLDELATLPTLNGTTGIGFVGLAADIPTNESSDGHIIHGDWNEICTEFQKMLFVGCLLSDRLSFSVSNFIVNNFGPQFVEPQAVLEDSTPQTPLFVLSPGVDPTGSLAQLAEAREMTKYYHSLSLGQEQAPVATRLWLSSSPNPEFPVSILQAGIKMTTEPPRISEQVLSNYLDEYEDSVPWDALKYLLASINYGGHVTDDWDRRLIETYVNQYFCEEAVATPNYRLSSLVIYYVPKDGGLLSYLDQIQILPTIDQAEAFGQHSNADITSLITETRVLCETLMSLQMMSSAGEGMSQEDKVLQLAAEVASRVPPPIDYAHTVKLIGDQKTPLDVVLLQEISRYNQLLTSMGSSLEELQKAIKGLVVMSSELEEIFTCMFDGRVPSAWLKAYSSLKLLGSWTRDLVLRVQHFKWAETTHAPLYFWLSAFTFPTGFLTAVLQEGVYVRGMFLEGAAWDTKNACLIEPEPMQLVVSMPIIHFKPMEVLKKRTKGIYVCPCCYFPIQCGSQGRAAYIVAIDLKSGSESHEFWVKRGTAILLSLAN